MDRRAETSHCSQQINAHNVFEKFELLANTPDALIHIRTLIQRAAVNGQLTSQLDSDGEAAEIFPELTTRESTTDRECPKNWIDVRFSCVGTQRLGKMLDKRGNKGNPKPYLRNTNVQWMRFELEDIKQILLEDSELNEFRLRSGDLLICEGGEPGRCAIWQDDEYEMYFQKAIHRVRPRQGILSEYLALCLRVDAGNGRLARHFTGATIKHLTGRSLREYRVAIPPLAEQKRIVAKVDELMGLCDRLEAEQAERQTRHAALSRAALARFADEPTVENLRFLFHESFDISTTELRATIMDLAVEGRITANDPLALPVTESCDELSALDTESIERDYPDNWRSFAFGSLGEWRGGGTPSKSQKAFWEGPIPWVSPKDMKRLRIDDAQDHISAKALESSSARLIPSGSIMMVVRGMILAKAFPVAIATREVATNQDMKSITPHTDLITEYLLLYLRARQRQFMGLVERSSHGTCKLKTDQLQKWIVPLPPIAEQNRIVAKVNQLMTLVDDLEQLQTESQSKAESLMEAVVAHLAS